MKRAAPLLAALGLLSLVALRAPRAHAAESANDCVLLREGMNDEGLTLAIDNNCDRRLTCSLTWTVQCESATGRVTRRTKDAVRLVVDASGSRSATASAKACGDNWRIEDVGWDCAPLK